MSGRGAKETDQARSGTFDDAPISFALILANLAIFAGEVLASRTLGSLSSVPYSVTLAFGANYAPLTLALGQYDRLVAACFVHASLLHVAANMWSLRQIGPFVERIVGSARFAILYVVTGIAGSVASVVWGVLSGNVHASVGASGAVCGVMGAALVLGFRLEGWRSGIAMQIAFWLVVLVVIGANVKMIDNACHFGGVVSGIVVAMAWRRGVRYSTRGNVIAIGLSAAICVVSGGAVLWRDATEPYGLLGANERGHLVQEMLREGDCPAARRALIATEAALKEPTPDFEGLRARVDKECPPGAP